MKKYKRPAVKLAVIYFLIGGAWIVISDQVVNLFHPSSQIVFDINIFKGLLFVSVTSVILFLIVQKYLERINTVSLDKQLTQQELNRSENLFYNVTNTSPVAVTILDVDGRISFANSSAEELLNLSRNKITEKSFDSPEWKITALDGSNFPLDDLPFQQVMKTKQSVFNVQHCIRLENKTKLFLSINASPLIDDVSGDIIGVVAIMRDITQKIQMEEELRKSESKYRILFEDNPQPMWVYELDSLKISDVNNAAIRKYGYSRKEFLSMTIMDIRPEEDIEKLELHIKDIREQNITQTDSLIWQHKLKNNAIIYVKILSHEISINNKQCRIILASDVTEVVKNEIALRQSEIKYRQIFENIVDVYFETTIGGKIVELSPSIKILSYGQYKREDLIGKQITSMYYDETERTSYIRQLIKYQRVDDYEIRLVNKDGRIIYCSLTAKLISEDGNQRIVGSMRDISVRINYEEDIIKAKEEAEKANKLKSEFLAQMSHEIRTPLNIILNSNQLIREELSEEKIKELEDIFLIQNSSGKRIIRTIDSIINMSELQIGSYEPVFQKIDLIKNILSELIDEYKIIAKEKELDLLLNNEIDNPLVYADRYSVSQIFANLIDNAIKYTDKGKVQINVYTSDDRIDVGVEDTGKGIKEDFKPFLFEVFRQEQQGYTRTVEGNGLGLAIVKKFCEINNAKINVDSKAGKGSTFTVEFEKYTE